VFVKRLVANDYIVQIHEYVGLQIGAQRLVEEALERGRGRMETERHDPELHQPLAGDGERGDGSAFWCERYLPVPTL